MKKQLSIIYLFIISLFILGCSILQNKKYFEDEDIYSKSSNGIVSYYDSSNNLLFQLSKDNVNSSFSEGLLAVYDSESGKGGYYNKTGNWEIAPIYQKVYMFSNSVAWAKNSKDLYCLIDLHGKELFTLSKGFVSVDNFKNGYAYVTKRIVPSYYVLRNDGSSEWISGTSGGIIDKKGKTVIPFSLATNTYYSSKLFMVQNETYTNIDTFPEIGLCGYKNKYNKWKILPTYKDAYSFANGFAVVSTEGTKFGLINTKGKEILSQTFSDIIVLEDNLFVVFIDDECFYLTNRENDKLSDVYTYLGISEDYISIADKENGQLHGKMNFQGKTLWESGK